MNRPTGPNARPRQYEKVLQAMSKNVPHQKLIDGLGVLLLEGSISKVEVLEIIASVKDQPDEIDEAILLQVRQDYSLE